MDETQDIFHKDETVLNYMENRQQIKIALSPLLKIRSSAKLESLPDISIHKFRLHMCELC